MQKNGFMMGFLLLLLGVWSCSKENLTKSSSFPPFLAWGFSIEGFPISKDGLEQVEQDTKIAAQIIQFYLQWPASSAAFDSLIPSLDSITNAGALPCITWEPMLIVDEAEKTIPYELILSGQYDAYLKHIAQEIKTWQKPLIIRFAHEMNLKRYHWGTTQEQFGPQSPDIYIKMFRYIVTLFKDQQINNVLWAFCPNVDADPNQPWNKVEHYYPGDQYVDILGMDGYNWAITPEIAQAKKIGWTKPWLSFEQLFSGLYQELKKISPHKPIMVFETATVDREGGKKKLWLEEALHTAKDWGLIAIIWFQPQKEEDWRIQQNKDYSYIPLIRAATSPFSAWIVEGLEKRASSDVKKQPQKAK